MRRLAPLLLLAGCLAPAPRPAPVAAPTVAVPSASVPSTSASATSEPPPVEVEPPREAVCDAKQARERQAPDLQEGCDQGDISACFRLGVLRDEEGDEEGAVAPLEKACGADKYEPRACRLRAQLIADSPTNRKTRNGFLERACQRGDGDGCYLLAVRRWTDGDATAARRLLPRACGNGSDHGCALLGWMQQAGEGGGRDRMQARASYRLAGPNDSLASCNRLSQFKANGFRSGMSMCDRGMRGCEAGCADDCAHQRTRARRMFTPLEEACQQGRKLACLIVAEVTSLGSYEAGIGVIVEQDARRAFASYSALCRGGLALACGPAAIYLHGGIEQAVDLPGAAKLYERGCAGGDGDACLQLGKMLAAGEGMTMNPTKALTYFERACQHESLLTCADLAEIYRTGDGVKVDPRKADAFAERARID